MSDIDRALGGISAIALGAYLAAVITHGNTEALLSELKKETGYLEFLVAVWVLWHLMTYKPIRDVSAPLVLGGILAIALKIAATSNISSKMEQFSSGQISLFGLFRSVIGE